MFFFPNLVASSALGYFSCHPCDNYRPWNNTVECPGGSIRPPYSRLLPAARASTLRLPRQGSRTLQLAGTIDSYVYTLL